MLSPCNFNSAAKEVTKGGSSVSITAPGVSPDNFRICPFGLAVPFPIRPLLAVISLMGGD
jgi:hypothetical protein